MKWLVLTLDTLTTNRSDQEAVNEQNHLQQLILRYKNLIPTIEITMTKTKVYSRSYTYKKEVHEVCTLLKNVRDEIVKVPAVDSSELLKNALTDQENRLLKLEQQRANIMSMLQRGRDILKDEHAPTFVSSEIQQLESSWNETYGRSMETMKTLKESAKLWSSYDQQKEEILRLISQAEDELKRVGSIPCYNAAQVSKDLQSQQELFSSLRKAATTMVEKLHETHVKLANTVTPEKRLALREEILETKRRVQATMEQVGDSVKSLQQKTFRWNKFQSKMGELQSWTRQDAPKLVLDIQDTSISPQEKVFKIEIFRKHIYEKIETLRILEEESRILIGGTCTF